MLLVLAWFRATQRFFHLAIVLRIRQLQQWLSALSLKVFPLIRTEIFVQFITV